MKKITLSLAIAIVILLFFSGCDKDIRDKYIGDWDFITEFKTEKCIYFDGYLHELEIIREDTIYFSGKIILGNSENELLFHYTQNDDISTFINKNGGIYVPDYPCPGSACTRGNFEGNNKVYLYFGWNYGDSIQSQSIIGTKKGGKK